MGEITGLLFGYKVKMRKIEWKSKNKIGKLFRATFYLDFNKVLIIKDLMYL